MLRRPRVLEPGLVGRPDVGELVHDAPVLGVGPVLGAELRRQAHGVEDPELHGADSSRLPGTVPFRGEKCNVFHYCRRAGHPFADRDDDTLLTRDDDAGGPMETIADHLLARAGDTRRGPGGG